MLIPIGGRPYLTYILDRLAVAGCDCVAIVVGHLGEMVQKSVGNRYRGVTVTYLIQESPTGTADALLLTESFIGREPFMMTWGDIVVASDNYERLWNAFTDSGADAVLLVNYMDDVSAGADVSLDGHRVIGIVEKPPGPKQGWNQTGVFVLSPIIFHYLRQVKISPRGEREFTEAVAQLISGGRRVYAVPLSGYRYELGNWDQLREIEENRHRLISDLP